MFQRFVSLPAARRRLLPVALPVLSGIRLLLALMPLRAVRRAVARVRLPVGLAGARVEDVAWAIDTAAFGSRAVDTCLAEALTADVLCRAAGVAAS